MCDRCDLLTEENAHLRHLLALETDIDLADRLTTAFRVPPQAGRVLAILYQTRGKIVSKGVLYDRLYDHAQDGDMKIVDVVVHRLRKAIGAELIGTVWGRGIALTVEGVAKVESVLNGCVPAQATYPQAVSFPVDNGVSDHSVTVLTSAGGV